MRCSKAYPFKVLLLLGLLTLQACQANEAQRLRISALKNTRRFPVKEAVPGVDVWNAAAVVHPSLGWIGLGTRSKCHWQECGPFGAGMRPWVAFLGMGSVPEVQKWSRAGHQWDLASDSLAVPFTSCGVGAETEYLIADFRYATASYRVLIGLTHVLSWLSS